MREGNGTKRWLSVLTAVAVAHAAAWYGFTQLRHDIRPPAPLRVIEVSLLPPPPPKTIAKIPDAPRPDPKVQEKPKTRREPRPLLPPQAVADRVMEQVAEPARPEAVPPAPTAPIVETAAEPVLEAPRFNAAYLNNPPPAYPLAARRRGSEGKVMVRAEVQADGSCSRVELKKTSGYDLLDQAALEAVKKWHFVPARKGTQAISAWVEVPITFKLEN